MRKNYISIFLIIALLITAISWPQTVYATASAEMQLLQQQREAKEREKQQTQQQLDQINDEIGDISDEKESVEEEIDALNDQITEVMTSISLMEEELAATEEQIMQAQQDYETAKAEEAAQYTAMKKRIQYLYEKGQHSYLQAFLTSKSIGDALNRAEYVQELYTYDQRMLDNYAAIVNEVAQLQTSLEEQKSELEACQYELGLEEDYLEDMLKEQKAIAADYAAQLSRAKQNAAAYKAKIKQQNEEIKLLEAAESAKRKEEEAKKKAEEEKKKTAAKNSTTLGSTGSSLAVSGSGMGSEIAKYACQFVGNPYVAGGTSLTNGADCSGFTQSVYKAFGISLPRTSGQQRSAGRGVSYAEAQPGDLICYAGHVAIYLGNGRIVHASSARTGIKYGTATYKTILAVRRIVD